MISKKWEIDKYWFLWYFRICRIGYDINMHQVIEKRHFFYTNPKKCCPWFMVQKKNFFWIVKIYQIFTSSRRINFLMESLGNLSTTLEVILETASLFLGQFLKEVDLLRVEFIQRMPGYRSCLMNYKNSDKTFCGTDTVIKVKYHSKMIVRYQLHLSSC